MRGSEAAAPSAETIALAISGDRKAVGAVVVAFMPRVFGLCYRLTGRTDVADEATQETFVRALRGLPQLRDPARFVPWILSIAANTAREVGRKSRPRAGPLEEDPPAIVRSDDPRRAAREAALEKAVAKLPEEERALFLLHSLEGVALAELARENRTTEPAMRSKVHRIRERVREYALSELRE
jgi:RNA polymerase sigma-70 factor (ECF subfamily)